MKYLLFNLLVVGALVYLLFDGKPPRNMEEAVDTAGAKAAQAVESGRRLLERQTSATEPERAGRGTEATGRIETVDPVPRAAARPVPRKPAQPTAPARRTATAAERPPDTSVAESTAPAPPRPSRAAKKAAPAVDDAVARRRAEVLTDKADIKGSPTGAGAALMTPRERRIELQRLAEDMELVFVDKVSR